MRAVLAAVAALGLAASARAAVLYTFDAGPLDANNWTGPITWSAGPSGWAGGGCAQTTYTTSGYQSWTPSLNFQWQDGSQAQMKSLALAGNGHLSFDIIVDGSSFTPGVSDWYQVSLSANSEGGWKQFDKIIDAWHDQGDNAVHVTHFDHSFADLGWGATSTWFQLNFGANSGASPVHFYIDNVSASAVPEPTILAGVGISSIGLLIRKRQK